MPPSKKTQRDEGGLTITSKRDRSSETNPAVVSSKDLTEVLGKDLGVERGLLEAVWGFLKLSDDARCQASQKAIQDCIIEAKVEPDFRVPLALSVSESLLEGYATLDEHHRREIGLLLELLRAYVKDSTRKRPFNVLMRAAPGSGKSRFVKQLAAKLKDERVEAVTFNMATMTSLDDMAQPVDELRNLKVNDRFPILFLDEFDSDPARYASLLPLLWDGELQIGHRDLKLGKVVIVLAGSSADIPKAMSPAEEMGLEPETGEGTVRRGKLVDLLSRINGPVIEIPDLDLKSNDRDRRVDKVCIAVSLIRSRFGNDLSAMPRCLLRFVAETSFRYGVRSIAHLADMIDCRAVRDGVLRAEDLSLPFKSDKLLRASSLKLHLRDKDQASGIVNRWTQLSTEDKAMVRFSPPHTVAGWETVRALLSGLYSVWGAFLRP
jgi:hypothetical protein